MVCLYVEFEKGEKWAKVGADYADNPDAFEDAGYLLTDNDLVVDIDCLNKDIIKKLISMFNIKTETVWTERGVHFYFKKPKTFSRGGRKICALGFEIELKHCNNTKAITVKRNGVLREIENPGVREDLPLVFGMSKKFENLLGFEEGDNRNNALFAHRSKLTGVDGWQVILRFINEFVFSEPLEEKEFQTISRDMRIEAKKDAEPEVAEWLMNEFKFCKYMKKLYFVDGKGYVSDDDKLIRLVFDRVGLQKTRYVDEVIRQIEYKCKLIEEPLRGFDIKLKNGILRDGEFIEVDYKEFTPYHLDVAYHPDAERVVEVDNYIDHLTESDPEYKELLMEILGHTLIVNKEFKRLIGKFFIFVGGGGNGKGTLLQIIKEILDPKNCTALSVKNMSDERYMANMTGKLANLGDDIQDEPIDNEQMKMLKNISTCDFVESRRLYENSMSIQLTTSLIFTSNHVLKSFEKGESYKRRVMWLPMFTKVEAGRKDPKFITKLTTQKALEYWLKLIVDGYMRLYKNGDFTYCKKVADYNKEYHDENNTCLMFLDDLTPDDIRGKRAPEVMGAYEIWAEENGLNVGSKKMMKEAIYEKFKMGIIRKSINGKTSRVYEEEDKTTQKIKID